MARPADWAVSIQSISDGVTPCRIFPKTWTMLSMAGSSPFSLDRECGSSAASSSSPGGEQQHEVTLLSQLTGMHLLSGTSMIWSYPWILHCVGPPYGQMAEVYLLIWTCVCMIRVSVCFVSFLPVIQQFTGPRQIPPYFRLILTFSYCLHEFLREQELETDRAPDTDMT